MEGATPRTARRRARRSALSAAAGLVVAGALVGACGSSSSTGTANVLHATSLVGKRYCEVLLVTTDGGLHATVYNTYPLNDCPEGTWTTLDATAIAKRTGSVAALLNGPRFWLMDSIAKVRTGPKVTRDFGGIAMIEEATVPLTPADLAANRTPYVAHSVDRTASFTFNKGRTIYELHDPAGHVWVMQTWSQQVDPNLNEAQLAGLGSRLTLPAGWHFSSRVLTMSMVVATQSTAARVLQDNLDNSYSLETRS